MHKSVSTEAKTRKNNNPSLLLISFMLLGSSLASCRNCNSNKDNDNSSNTNSTQHREGATSNQHQPVNDPKPNLPPTITTKMIQEVEAKGVGYTHLVAVLKKLKDNKPVNVNEKDFTGNTALNDAIDLEDGAKVVQVLLEKGASLLMPDSAGWMPLYHAAANGNIETTKVLIAAMKAKKLNINIKNTSTNQTAYQKAKELYNPHDPDTAAYKDIMNLLAAAGADTK